MFLSERMPVFTEAYVSVWPMDIMQASESVSQCVHVSGTALMAWWE